MERSNPDEPTVRTRSSPDLQAAIESAEAGTSPTQIARAPFAKTVLSRNTLVLLLRGVAAGVACAVLISVLDCVGVVRAVEESPNVLRLWASDFGLMLPLAWCLGVFGAVLAISLHAPRTVSLSGLLRWLRPFEARRRARLAAITLLGPVAVVIAIVTIAQVSVRTLSVPGPSNAMGAVLAASAVGIALFWLAVVLALARTFGVRYRAQPPDPAKTGAMGLGIAIVAFMMLVLIGNTSGAGGPFGILGVFRRQELDLRAPLYVLMILLSGYLSQMVSERIAVSVLASVALLPLTLTAYAAKSGMDSRSVANGIERYAPVGRAMLGPMRRLGDRDRDGFSSLFGGGDCNDRNPSINPSVDDVPGNEIDEDCSGSDAKPQAAIQPVPLASAVDYHDAIRPGLNLVLLTIDTVRADVLGNERHVVPNLDRLAEKSIVFDKAYSPASYTGKSVGPFIIGKNSSETQRDFSHFNAFRKETFVQERLQRAGIRTISVQGYWYFYQPPYGFERGFDVIDSSASPGQGYVEGDRTTNADKQADRVIEQLKDPQNTSKQFYLWAHFTDPHAEYVPHAGFDFGNDQKGKYLGEVGFVDAQLGRIFDTIAASEYAARTAIIVTSDHGEAFGEHGMYRHGFELWEALIRVPLIVYIPETKPRRIEARRSLIDLVPTMLDIMKVPLPGSDGPDFLSGHSLGSDIFSQDNGEPEIRPVFVDMSAGPNNAERQAFIEGTKKLITTNGRPLGLYDLAGDPDEKHDLLDDAELKNEVLTAFKAYRRQLKIVRIAEKRPN